MEINLKGRVLLEQGAFEIKHSGYLVGAKKEKFSHIDRKETEKKPFFEGNPDDFLEKNGNNPVLKEQLKNKVTLLFPLHLFLIGK